MEGQRGPGTFCGKRAIPHATARARRCSVKSYCLGMTLSTFVAKSAFRNKRRSLLTVASIAFSLLLLCIMLCVWRSFYIDKGAPDSALRIMTRHKVSLANFLPIYYRDKIRTIRGVVHVVPMTWFGGTYKDDKPENFFAQFATDPDEYST